MANAKISYERSLIADFANKHDYRIFSYIKSLTSRHTIPPTMHLNSTSATSDYDKAILFNQFFNSIFSAPPNSALTDQLLSTPPSTMCDLKLSESVVYRALADLDQHKSKGIDDISPCVLAHCALPQTDPVLYLFRLCVDHHSIPDEWHAHRIIPIFKSGDRSSVTNYRPISLLCILSKVFKRIIYDQIIEFILPSISNRQFGFFRQRSTVHQLIPLLE